MGANEKFAAALHPDGPSGVPALLAAADKIRDRILGFLVQCDCGQQALVATQPEKGWVCPRCTEIRCDIPAKDFQPNVTPGFGDIDIAAAEPIHVTHQPCPHQDIRYGVCADCGDYPGITGVTA